MTIDEAISHAREVAKRTYEQSKEYSRYSDECFECEKCAEEHEQLAQWLEELKFYRARIFSGEMTQAMLRETRIKTIDEAMEKTAKAICIGCGYLEGTKCTYNGANCQVSKPMLEVIVKALEELKAGGDNGSI